MTDRVVTAIADRRGAILDVIRGARRSIALSLFRCNDEAFLDELTRAVARGVDVQVLTTSNVKGGKEKVRKLWDALATTGASVRAYNEPVVKYHAKYLIADEGPAVVASLNFTRKCFAKTCDAIVVTHDPAIVSSLRALWAADAERAPLPDGLSPRLIIGPERARRQFTTIIEGAQSSIKVIDPKLSDPDLVTMLKARSQAGLPVQVFGDARVGGLKSHGKLMIVDDRLAVVGSLALSAISLDYRLAVVGSLALSAISLDFRREVAITLDQPEAVAAVRDVFRAAEEGARDSGSGARSEIRL
jgi:phosphatidylserine/phosphatidylglycerophosphate/cardiolipin synthase-like enzyme